MWYGMQNLHNVDVWRNGHVQLLASYRALVAMVTGKPSLQNNETQLGSTEVHTGGGGDKHRGF
jgi:hypothetical protein